MPRRQFQLYDGTIMKSPFWWPMFWRTWHFGRTYKYPVCCVLRFSFDCARGRSSIERRGIDYRTPASSGNDNWIPCGVFHRRDEER
jgi:hypothetical protein